MKFKLPKITTNARGQVIIVLLLVMLLALSIGLAITQRTTTDLQTSSQTEQSTRAFSAAEAGLEKALSGTGTYGTNETPIQLGNDTSAQLVNSGLLPIAGQYIGVEYPPIGKETITQFWLIDNAVPPRAYSRNSLYIYFGNYPFNAFNTTDNFHPAIEVNIITCEATAGVCTSYQNQRSYYDSSPTDRLNGFLRTGSSGFSCNDPAAIPTIINGSSRFACQILINIANCTIPSCIPQAVRIRLLYANVNQKVAILPVDGTSAFPPQIELYTSKGKSGQTEKTLQLFRVKEMMPSWMDFAIFSINNINKS